MNVYTEIIKQSDNPSVIGDAAASLRKTVDLSLIAEAKILSVEAEKQFKDNVVNLGKSARFNAFVIGYLIQFPNWAYGYLKLTDKELKMIVKANKDMTEICNRIFTVQPQRPNLAIKLYNHVNQF